MEVREELHCHHQNDFCIKMGSDESHFNVSVGSDGQSHKTVSTNHNLFEEKGEPKRYRTQVLQLTGLTARPIQLTQCDELCPGNIRLWSHPCGHKYKSCPLSYKLWALNQKLLLLSNTL